MAVFSQMQNTDGQHHTRAPYSIVHKANVEFVVAVVAVVDVEVEIAEIDAPSGA